MSRSSRSSRRSTTPRSARMTSSSIARTSRAGSTEPAGCGDRRIAEHPDHVQQRVGVAERRDVEQRLRAGLRARHAGDVGELHGGRHPLARVEQRGQLIEAFVGHPRHAHVRVRLAASRGRVADAGQELEERRLAGGRKSNQACTQHKNKSVYRAHGRRARRKARQHLASYGRARRSSGTPLRSTQAEPNLRILAHLAHLRQMSSSVSPFGES